MANLKYKDKNTNTWQSILLTRGAIGPQGPAGKNAEISLNGEINQEVAIYAPVDAGVSGQVLVSKGENQAPQWENVSPGSGSSDVYTVDNLDAIEVNPNEALSAHQGYVLNQNKVEKSTTIAGLPLTGNISVSELNNSLKTISGDGSIAKIIELTYAEYKTLESNGELQDDIEYHINDMSTIAGIGAKASQVEMTDGTDVESNIKALQEFDQQVGEYFETEYDPRLTNVETKLYTLNDDLDAAEQNIETLQQNTTTSKLIDLIYPVGSFYMSMNETDPGLLFGGTWVHVGGRFLLGATMSSDTGLNTYGYIQSSAGYWYHFNLAGERINLNGAGVTWGEVNHTLTVDEMPSHVHDGVRRAAVGNAGGLSMGTSSGSANTDYLTNATGGGLAHNNMPPYFTVHMWYRTA